MTVKVFEIILLLLFSLYSDIKTHKVKNFITIPFIVLGLVTNTLITGYSGFMNSIYGITLPVFLLFILYYPGMLGAGDVKLFAAIGAIMGIKIVISSIAASFLAGGFAGMILLVTRKNTSDGFCNLFTYLKCCFLSRRLLEYDLKLSGTFPFVLAIVPGATAAVIYALVGGCNGD